MSNEVQKQLEELDFTDTMALMMVSKEVTEAMNETNILEDLSQAENSEEVERLVLESEKIVYEAFGNIIKNPNEIRESVIEAVDFEDIEETYEEALANRTKIVSAFMNMHYEAMGSDLRVGKNITLQEIDQRNGVEVLSEVEDEAGSEGSN